MMAQSEYPEVQRLRIQVDALLRGEERQNSLIDQLHEQTVAAEKRAAEAYRVAQDAMERQAQAEREAENLQQKIARVRKLHRPIELSGGPRCMACVTSSPA